MKLISYIRVSTREQGDSGLGLDAQLAAVRQHCKAAGASVVESFREIESGKNADRPQLATAIAACRKHRATLVVAKLDRLARNVAFVSTLMDSGVDFVCCDNPNANRLTVHILAAVAEDEARRISTRTNEALAQLKASGVQLGNPKPLKAARLARAANSEAAARHVEGIRPLAERKRKAGKTLQEIADFLTGKGLRTRRGQPWSAVAVMRLLS